LKDLHIRTATEARRETAAYNRRENLKFRKETDQFDVRRLNVKVTSILKVNQTAEERKAYQRKRTREIKDADEANRTPKIRRLQKREGELQSAYNRARDPKKAEAIKKEYREVSAQLCEELGLT